MSNRTAIVIKKVKKGGHGGHHGGAWKVAYADFVTAMMAFFLLLWLLNATTEKQKRGVADYFDPTVSTRPAGSGSGGFLAGRVVAKSGVGTAESSPLSMSIAYHTNQDEQEDDKSSPADDKSDDERSAGSQDNKGVGTQANKGAGTQDNRGAGIREEQAFAKAEEQLKQAINDAGGLGNLAGNLVVDRALEGLRIQIIDRDNASMFPSGSSDMLEPAKKLLTVVAGVMKRLPNQISITGHTDATPYAKSGGYGNWELSTDRANASRRELLNAGVDPGQIATVVGKADRDPVVPDQPTSARNRRISIVLLRQAAPPPTKAADATNPAAPPGTRTAAVR